MLKVGDKAPDFTLNDQSGNSVSLNDFLGKKVIVYFYPKDNTPGCTRQACAFAANYEKYCEKGIVVLGISKDDVKSHERFSSKFSLPFIILSDPELKAIKEYGAWGEKKNYGKSFMGVHRITYVIDEKGYILHVMPKVKPDTNAEEILDFLK